MPGGDVTPRTISQREKEAKALELRKQGQSYDQIALELGMANRMVAWRLVHRAFDRITAEPASEMKLLELARLDDVLTKAYEVMHAPHYVAITSGPNAGDLVRHPETEELLIDDGPKLAAIDRVVKIGERRAKLAGLDAPVQTRVGTIPNEVIQEEIARLEAQEAAARAA